MYLPNRIICPLVKISESLVPFGSACVDRIRAAGLGLSISASGSSVQTEVGVSVVATHSLQVPTKTIIQILYHLCDWNAQQWAIGTEGF